MKSGAFLKANLFIPGAMKSGTSSLHMYLNQHPDICMSSTKEPHFISRNKRFQKGPAYYNSLFNNKPDAKYFGESSTNYLSTDRAIERIKSMIENPKFIIILRNPIERTYSHYAWLASLGVKVLPFKEEIIRDMKIPYDPDIVIKGIGYKNYIHFSKYGEAVEKYYNSFGKENILIIKSKELNINPNEILNNCFAFLELSSLNISKEVNENVTRKNLIDKSPLFFRRVAEVIPSKVNDFFNVSQMIKNIFTREGNIESLSEIDRFWLAELLKDDVTKLKKISGLDFTDWIEFNE